MSDTRQLQAEIDDLRAQLQSAQETARALIAREVDAITQSADGTPALLREAQAALREGRARLRAVFQGALDGMLLMDDEARILDANDAALRLCGVTRDEILGKTPASFAAPDEDFEEAWRAFLETQLAEGERTIVRPDGERRTVEIRAKANISPGQHLAVLRDVSERRGLEDALRRSHRLESVGRLAGGIAHDFNNLLMAISGFTSVVKSGLAPSDPMQENLDEVLRAADRGADLVHKMLAFGRRQMLLPKPVTVGEIVTDAVRMTGTSIPADIELLVGHGADDAIVHVDAAQIEQVLVNLLLNARDAVPHGGTITLETAVERIGEGATETDQERPAPGTYAVLSVTDTGAGMDAATREQIFEPFFSTKDTGEGLGMGLSTAYGIVRQSLGHIECQSAPGKGSTFRIYLPLQESAPATATAAAPEKGSAEAPEGETILVVEDSDAIRRLATQVLRRAGYRVLEAAQPGDALLASEQEAGPIHLLLSDVVMPRMRGPALAKRITARRPETRVLFISGYAADDVSEGSDVELLSKPFRPEELLTAVRRVLDGPASSRVQAPGA